MILSFVDYQTSEDHITPELHLYAEAHQTNKEAKSIGRLT